MVRVGGEVEWIKGITGRFVRNFLTFTFSPSRRRISHVRAPRGRLISRKGSGGRSWQIRGRDSHALPWFVSRFPQFCRINGHTCTSEDPCKISSLEGGEARSFFLRNKSPPFPTLFIPPSLPPSSPLLSSSSGNRPLSRGKRVNIQPVCVCNIHDKVRPRLYLLFMEGMEEAGFRGRPVIYSRSN